MAFRAAPTQGALFSLAPVAVNEGRGDDAIPLEQEGVIFYDPITLTVLDPEGSELCVAAGFCDVSTRTGGSHAHARASGMATTCWCRSLLPAPEGVTAVDADVKVLVPPTVLVKAVFVTFEGPGVLVFAALAVLDVDGDKLLDPARAEVLVGSGVEVAINPVVLDDVNASTLVLTAVANDDMPLLNACVVGLGVAILVILEVVDDVKTSVVAALVADDVLLLEVVADADVKVRVPSAVLVKAISATVELP